MPVHVVLSYKLQYTISNKSNPDKLTIRTGNEKHTDCLLVLVLLFTLFDQLWPKIFIFKISG